MLVRDAWRTLTSAVAAGAPAETVSAARSDFEAALAAHHAAYDAAERAEAARRRRHRPPAVRKRPRVAQPAG